MPVHPGGGYRKDFMGIIDIICFDDKSTIGVQSCGQNFAEHKRKLYNHESTKSWINDHRQLWLIGWRKLKLKRGGKAMRWMPRIEIFENKSEKDEQARDDGVYFKRTKNAG